VAASGGLTVGGLRAALSSADPSVQCVAEKVRACVLEPAWQAAMLAQHMPAPAWLVSHCGQYVCWRDAPSGERGYVVRHDGRLAPLEAGCDL
jgi:hypothetical protein